MSQTTVNPYEETGGYIMTGLASIAGTLSTGYTIDDLVNAVATYVESVYYPSGTTTQIENEIMQVARTGINNYVSSYVLNGLAGYNAKQFRFIEPLIGKSLTAFLPVESIADRIEDVEDNLTDNKLTITEQTPLLLATTIGTNALTYWNQFVQPVVQGASTPVANPWTPYLPPNQESYMNFAYLVAAAMNGALSAYAATPLTMVEPSTNFVTNRIVSALTGALTVTAGKAIFGWTPRIQHRMEGGQGDNPTQRALLDILEGGKGDNPAQRALISAILDDGKSDNPNQRALLGLLIDIILDDGKGDNPNQ